MFLIGGLLRRIVVAGVLVVAVLVAGWWFFVREDNKVQEAASDITDDVRQAAQQQASPTAGATAAASAAAGGSPTTAAAQAGPGTIRGKTYRIVAGQSKAWYLAPEKLSRLPTSSVAKGETSGVTGTFAVADAGLDPATPTAFTIDLRSLKSDENQRDSRTQSALETSRFPTATFRATKLEGLPAQFGATDSVMRLTGMLTVHGVEKEVTWELKAKQDGDIISVLGTLETRYDTWGITKPNVAGFVTVEDTVTIQVQLFLAPG